MPPSDDLRAELQRRQTFTADVLALFKSRPNEWIDASELAKVGGSLAWRTRVADARKVVTAEGGAIDNRLRRNVVEGADGRNYVSGPVISEYCYLPKPAADVVQEPQIAPSWPVFDAPSQEPWTLKP